MTYRFVIILFVLPGLFTEVFSQNILAEFNARGEQILQETVIHGMIDYNRASEVVPEIDRFKHEFLQINIRDLSPDSLMAFYINVYNLMMLLELTRHYPQPVNKQFLRRIDQVNLRTRGSDLTLSDIRKHIISQIGKGESDLILIQSRKEGPRPLNIFYNGNDLDRQVAEACQQVLNDPFLIRLEPAEREVFMSVFFRELLVDFSGRENSLLRFINQYRSQNIPYGFDIRYFDTRDGWNALPYDRVRETGK